MITSILDWALPTRIKIVLRALLSRFIGFTRVSSWQSGLDKSTGYESTDVIEPVLEMAQQFRDSQVTSNFASSRYQQVAAGILYCVGRNNLGGSQPIRVLDIGGGGADYFYQLEKFAPHLNFDWTVLETPVLAKAMQREFGSHVPNLRWVDSPDQTNERYDVVVCSSVLQYLEKPFETLSSLVRKSEFIVMNRLPLVEVSDHFVAVQRIVTNKKRGSYPAHFFSETRFLEELSQYGTIKMRWLVPEDQPVINWKARPNQGLVLHVGLFE